MNATIACYHTDFKTHEGWTFEPYKAHQDARLQAPWTGDGRWWSPSINLDPFRIYELDIQASASQRLYWAAKHFDADGTMLDADHYATLPASESTAPYRSFFRVPVGAHSTRLLFEGIDGVSYSIQELTLQPAVLADLEAWWRRLLLPFPALNWEPPTDRWRRMPRTAGIIGEGGKLRVLMLGDSIINDIANSVFEYPLAVRQGVEWQVIPSVRGATGCAYYVDHLDTYVTPYDPDLVIIGGRSQCGDLAAIETVVAKLSSQHDVLVMSAGFPKLEDGTIIWQSRNPPTGNDYSCQLARLAESYQVNVIDLEVIIHQYLDSHELDPVTFLRDAVHVGDLGRAFYARLMNRYFAA